MLASLPITSLLIISSFKTLETQMRAHRLYSNPTLGPSALRVSHFGGPGAVVSLTCTRIFPGLGVALGEGHSLFVSILGCLLMSAKNV